MGKQPTAERFRIICETEAETMGPIIAQLTRMGLTNVHFELITDVVRFNKNEKQIHDVNGADFLAEWIKDHPTFRALDAANYFRENNRTAGSAYTTLRVLVEKKLLNKISAGNYSRPDVKAIAAPKHAKAKPKTFEKPGREVVLTYARRNHGRFSTQKLIGVFAKEGRSRNSIYGSINDLLNNKLCKRIGKEGSGEYVLVSRPKSEKAPKKKPPSQANGAHVETPEAVING